MKTTYLFIVMILSTFISTVTHAETKGHSCIVNEVKVMNSLIYIKCSMEVWNVRYYALPLNDPKVALFADLANSALDSGRYFIVSYESTDTSGVQYGCELSNCRRPRNFSVEHQPNLNRR